MPRVENILQAIGHTPLVRLQRMTAGLASPVYAKLEMINPGGSVKDRVARAMIEAAEREGALRPGGTIVEATAGNTGVGLALAAAVKGYRLIVVMPDKMSRDKMDLLRAYGAEVVVTATQVPPDSPESYNGVAARLAAEIPGAYRPNQFANPNNPLTHYRTTGPEIWKDTDGNVGVFVAGMGTGGTISGVARYLKERNPEVTIVGADPVGSILSGDAPQAYQVEGIGEDFIPKTFDRQVVDEMVRVSDKESFNMARRLAREEGLLAGGSSGTALAAALRYAQRLEHPRTIVVMLPDTGRNYLSKIYNDEWMREQAFWQAATEPSWTVGQVLAAKRRWRKLLAVAPGDPLQKVIDLMAAETISQVPVMEQGRCVGSLNESAVMKLLHDGIDGATTAAGEVMGRPLPAMDEHGPAAEAYRLLLGGASGILVTAAGAGAGVLTRSDLIAVWRERRSAAFSSGEQEQHETPSI